MSGKLFSLRGQVGKIKTVCRRHPWLAGALFASVFLFSTGLWIRHEFGICTVEQVMFHVMMPSAGVDAKIVSSFIRRVLLISACIFAAVSYLLCRVPVLRENLKKAATAFSVCFLALFFTSFSGYTFVWTSLFNTQSDFYAERFVPVEPDSITFSPKRNLILLYLESMETTYSRPEVFGNNLMPRLSALRTEHATIPDAVQVYGTGWTISGVVSSMCGVPLRLPQGFQVRKMGDYGEFLPNAVCMTDIRTQNGYATRILQGSRGTYAGHGTFFATHSVPSADFLDYDALVAKYPDSEAFQGTGWGLRDSQIYKLAKKELASLAVQETPFAVVLRTADTHPPDGYVDPECGTPYGDFRDVTLCADEMAASFLDWVAKQPFADDTLVVVMSDHLAMPNPLWDALTSRPELRRNLNIFINPARPIPSPNRRIAAMDMAPSILEAMGAHLPGGKLGLGVSVYSGAPTLVEEMGQEALNAALSAYSRFYASLLYKKETVTASRKIGQNKPHKDASTASAPASRSPLG